MSRNKQLLRMRRRRSRRRACNKAFTKKFRQFLHWVLDGGMDALILDQYSPREQLYISTGILDRSLGGNG